MLGCLKEITGEEYLVLCLTESSALFFGGKRDPSMGIQADSRTYFSSTHLVNGRKTSESSPRTLVCSQKGYTWPAMLNLNKPGLLKCTSPPNTPFPSLRRFPVELETLGNLLKYFYFTQF